MSTPTARRDTTSRRSTCTTRGARRRGGEGPDGCADDLKDYLNKEQFLHQGQHLTKYQTPDPDPDAWRNFVVGEGIKFQPLMIDLIASNAAFRDLIDGGCTNFDGEPILC